jgi:hypothetical protein
VHATKGHEPLYIAGDDQGKRPPEA